MMNQDEYIGPINVGNPDEYTILELASTIQRVVNPDAEIQFKEIPSDDPRRRQPDITLAKRYMEWKPTIPLLEGLQHTIADFKKRMRDENSYELYDD